MGQHGRKRSVSCREEPQSSSSAWEPASKRLRTLVHQMRSLSLGDLPWSRRRAARDGRPADPPPPTPDPTPVTERRRLPAPAAAAAAAADAHAAGLELALSARFGNGAGRGAGYSNGYSSEYNPRYSDGYSDEYSGPSGGFTAALSPGYRAAHSAGCSEGAPHTGSYSDEHSAPAAAVTHGSKRADDEPAGGRAKKARSRMRLGTGGVVVTSCYIEQTLYT